MHPSSHSRQIRFGMRTEPSEASVPVSAGDARAQAAFHMRLRAVPLSGPAALSFSAGRPDDQWRLVGVPDGLPGEYAVAAFADPCGGSAPVGVVAALGDGALEEAAGLDFDQVVRQAVSVYGAPVAVALRCEPGAISWIALRGNGHAQRVLADEPSLARAQGAPSMGPECSLLQTYPQASGWIFARLAGLICESRGASAASPRGRGNTPRFVQQ